jgi:hypothetical protein
VLILVGSGSTYCRQILIANWNDPSGAQGPGHTKKTSFLPMFSSLVITKYGTNAGIQT